jgi:hypothetical protein
VSIKAPALSKRSGGSFDHGQKVFIGIHGSADEVLDRVRTLRREFGPKLKQFLFTTWLPSRQAAEKLFAIVSD